LSTTQGETKEANVRWYWIRKEGRVLDIEHIHFLCGKRARAILITARHVVANIDPEQTSLVETKENK
jgi:hypothetical protein